MVVKRAGRALKCVLVTLVATAVVLPAAAATATVPAFDSSANASLTGTYSFRCVIYLVGDANGDLSSMIAVNGTLIFDGAGNYTIPAGATELLSGAARPDPDSPDGHIYAFGERLRVYVRARWSSPVVRIRFISWSPAGCCSGVQQKAATTTF